MNLIKRNGQTVPFNKTKIKQAIVKAMRNGSGIYLPDIARLIANDAEKYFEKKDETPTISQVEKYVYQRLIHYGQDLTARAYEEFRAVQAFKRETNTTDFSVLGLVRGTNKETMNENSNKNARVASTQRDLIAGEISKDLARRKLIPAHIVQAHDTGAIHYHDMDYAIQPIFNCCLVNIKDMLDNGTVINGKMVESPKSFQVACTVMTQIIAQISSGQYGGQTLNVKHLGKYLALSRKKYQAMVQDLGMSENLQKEMVDRLLRKELEAGVQTIQYQINTLMTTNGQSPFVTLFLEIEPGHEYEEEVAMIIEEIIKQRHLGIKNEVGVYVTPSFPKLVYVLDENNIHATSKYRYITEAAARCTAKRLYPDYISAKEMRKIYEGNVFGPMGCRAFLSPWKDANGEYKFEGRFNMGVVSLNLPQIAIIADGDMEAFWEILDQRLALAKEALMVRYELLKDATSDISPIHWQHGGLARLGKHEPILPLLQDGYATITLGYIGMYEMTKLMTGKSHTEEKEFALEVMRRMKQATLDWKEETGLAFALYGTPAESLCHRFAKIDLARFGSIKDITDKGYYTNSYHVDVREEINAFDKLSFEADFQKISTGGCISYVEIPNMSKNIEALEDMIEFIYENIQYAEFNTKSDYCQVCGFSQEIIINDEGEWECPQCHNKDQSKMNVTRRTCGYLGDNFWNEGKTKEIKSRVLHI
ncbi:MAG: anaerobic ribonucleoside-triphosphate reductase [Lachnospiraceae bacterium]|nr:anaerobic ribonucleoside-triphosphate reductase [Lachnospiraceae bacterium]MBP3906760.1 anaerobic ribonucleoside-triphosphate reductase [Peptostreptococcaceae bacterium]